jgi:hypothetical protein
MEDVCHNKTATKHSLLLRQFGKDCSKSIPYSGFLSCEWTARLTAGDEKDSR